MIQEEAIQRIHSGLSINSHKNEKGHEKVTAMSQESFSKVSIFKIAIFILTSYGMNQPAIEKRFNCSRVVKTQGAYQ